MAEALAVIIGYLLGSIPSAYIVGRLRKGIDIRQVGGGNMGALNAVREVGLGAGVAVLFADVAKGVLSYKRGKAPSLIILYNRGHRGEVKRIIRNAYRFLQYP